MQTPYVLHIFGEEVVNKFKSRRGWLTAGVASSVPWPSLDVCIQYAGDEYILRGSERDGKPSPPGITIGCNQAEVNQAMAKIYRLTSVLGWFLGGYVDVGGQIWGSHPFLYGDTRKVYSSMGVAGVKSFNCNHMPVIEQDNIRKALAFWREGKRLLNVHAGFSFLSFYKVVESQFSNTAKKIAWISNSIDKLTDRAGERVQELRTNGVDVSRHLFESCRCAVAHASLDGEIIDPDIPEDRNRLAADLVVMEQLAHLYIQNELRVPDSRSLYRSRDRLAPWDSMFSLETLALLRKGKAPDGIGLDGQKVSIGIWPDGPIPGLEATTARVVQVLDGIVSIVLVNDRETVVLLFHLDYVNGRLHTDLEQGGLTDSPATAELDVTAYATFFYKVLGNAIAELTISGFEPIDCEVVIPVNILPPNPDKAIDEMVERFRQSKKGGD